MKQLVRHILTPILLLALILVASPIYGQSKDQAYKLYRAKDYAGALKIYEKLQRQRPSDRLYNLRCGICRLRLGDSQQAINYLERAVKARSTDAFLFLGEAYFNEYNFGKSAESYAEYRTTLAKKKGADLAPLDSLIDLSQKAQRMLSNMEDVQIIDSLILPKSSLMQAYHPSASVGHLIPFNTLFPNEPKQEGNVQINEMGNRAFYARKASSKSDIFMQTKSHEGWSDEQPLDGINTEANEIDPLMMPDGVTLYFASDRADGLGGYDLYISRFHAGQERFLKPELMPIPFNSTANDYMLILDEEKGIGWFATDRFQPADTVIVYTFIPNPTPEMLMSEDETMLAHRAKITAIQESWREEGDYAALIALARKEAKQKQQAKGAIRFVIQDDRIYTSLDDFHNEGAKNLYLKSQELATELAAKNRELEWKYGQYQKVDASKREALGQEILTLEQAIEQLRSNQRNTTIRARNEEIRGLQTQP